MERNDQSQNAYSKKKVNNQNKNESELRQNNNLERSQEKLKIKPLDNSEGKTNENLLNNFEKDLMSAYEASLKPANQKKETGLGNTLRENLKKNVSQQNVNKKSPTRHDHSADDTLKIKTMEKSHSTLDNQFNKSLSKSPLNDTSRIKKSEQEKLRQKEEGFNNSITINSLNLNKATTSVPSIFPNPHTEQLHEKLKDNVTNFIKRHRFSAILLGSKDYAGKTGDEYLQQLRAHATLLGIGEIQRLSQTDLEHLIDDYINKQVLIKKESELKSKSRTNSPERKPLARNENRFDPSKSTIGFRNNYTLDLDKDRSISPSKDNVNAVNIDPEEVKRQILKSCSNPNDISKLKIRIKIKELTQKELELSPIPFKKLKNNKVETDDYYNAARTAVFARRIEYAAKLQNLNNEKFIDEIYNELIYEAKVVQIQRWYKKLFKALQRKRNPILNGTKKISQTMRASVLNHCFGIMKGLYIHKIRSYNIKRLYNMTHLIFLQRHVKEFCRRIWERALAMRKAIMKCAKRRGGFAFKQMRKNQEIVKKVVVIQKISRGNLFRRSRKMENIKKKLTNKPKKIDEKSDPKENFSEKIRSYINNKTKQNQKKASKQNFSLEMWFSKWKSLFKSSKKMCLMIKLGLSQVISSLAFRPFLNAVNLNNRINIIKRRLPLFKKKLRRNFMKKFIYNLNMLERGE